MTRKQESFHHRHCRNLLDNAALIRFTLGTGLMGMQARLQELEPLWPRIADSVTRRLIFRR